MSTEHRPPGHGCGENAAPYVLGALDERESELFREHLESCAVCREEVASLQVVVDALPAAAPQLSAPPALKRRVMSAVREEARDAPERRRERPARRLSLGRWRSSPWALAAAGAIAAALVLAVVALWPGGGGSRVVRAQVHLPGASAVLHVSGGRGELRLTGMPQTSPSHVYELWLKRAGAPQPTDVLFTVSARGDATVGVPGLSHGVREVLVTSEPRGGSAAPTSAPVIVARVS